MCQYCPRGAKSVDVNRMLLRVFFAPQDVDGVLKALNARGVMCDVRRPNVMRIAPTPLYNSFSDVFEFVQILKDALASL